MKQLIPIGSGKTADVFKYKQGKIIKLFKEGFPISSIKKEYKISKYVYPLDIKTPQTFQLINIENRLGIVFEEVKGASMLEVLSAKPWLVFKLLKDLASLQFAFHQQSVGGPLEEQKRLLADKIRAVNLLKAKDKEKIIDYLKKLPSDNKLCHGDFHFDNVLMDQEQWIIDWMDGIAGNPAGDVARSSLLLGYASLPSQIPKLLKLIINFFRIKIKDVYINYYLNLTDLDYQKIEEWILPIAAARLIEEVGKEEEKQLLNLIQSKLNNKL